MKKKVLVIDDEPVICEILTRVLEPAGYIVMAETSPLRGLKLAEDERPDCVILDFRMPIIDGLEVLSRIMEMNKDAKVIMIAGGATIEMAMKAIKLGAYDCISKPFDLDHIKMTVARSLRSGRK